MSNDNIHIVMNRPAHTPIGLELARTARLVGRAFDRALAAAGGSLPVWLVLLNLKIGANANQRELAESVGVTEATLTHHLNAMEASGLLTRRRDPGNRRVQLVEPTAAGEELFGRLRDAAFAFDRRLRRGITADSLAELESLLSRLVENAVE
jgi:MarR family transcriptional regulator, transcriptional regulator for hemolysin